MKQTLTFDVSGTLGPTIALGCFLALMAFIPTSIVTYQWLTARPDAETTPHTDPAAAIPGLAIVLYGIALATRRSPVTIDAEQGTLTFRRSVFGVTYRTDVWRRREVQVIEIVHNNAGFKLQGWTAWVRGARGTKVLLGYANGNAPAEVRESARLLNLPVRYPQDPEEEWRG